MCSTAKLVCPWVQRTCSGKVPPWVPDAHGLSGPESNPGARKKERPHVCQPIQRLVSAPVAVGPVVVARGQNERAWQIAGTTRSGSVGRPSLQGLLPPLISPTWTTHSNPRPDLFPRRADQSGRCRSGSMACPRSGRRRRGHRRVGLWALAASSNATIRDRLRRYRVIHFLQIVVSALLDVGFLKRKRTKNKR